MQYLTTTQLRTQSTDLVKALLAGQSINLIHRSKVVGEISPVVNETNPLTEKDILEIKCLAQNLNLPKLSYNQREKIYRRRLTQKYGRGLS